MGAGCHSRLSGTSTPTNAPLREVKIVVFGLDNSGKSTLLANLNGDSTDDITPTIGFSSTKLTMKNCTVTFYDVGGGPRIRGIWKNYYSEAYGIVYVVDSSTPERFTEATNALTEVMQHEKMAGKPLLVFANKQDQDDACSDTELANQMDLDRMLGNNRQYSSVVKCIALKKGNKSDPSLRRGVSWLLGSIVERYEEISERQRVDVAAQREREAEERRQRMERVKKLREERERQQALNGEVVEEVDGGPPANPFKPISEVAVEVERREQALKEAKRRQSNVASAAETTASQSTQVQDVSRVDSAYASPGPSDPTLHRPSGSSISQPSSGLSDSESLTDVTEPSANSSTDSLPVVTPLPLDDVPSKGSRSSSPTVARQRRLEPVKSKKQQKEMLLSRLKRRNKTAPAPHSSHTHAPHPHAPVASRNTWTGAELESVVPDTTVPEDPLHGLPALPSTKRVLPPIQISRQGAGMGHKPFHIDEDVTFIPQSAVVQISHPPTPQTCA